ncbi:helix-turn-helix domain-containing protein [Streptomyces bullii]|uniref:Helix-turn-helix domain-containing protein n=1 Tax=Streptomyces bullii TaxID=349910 RepID=A0ABW0UJG3_9ACTN
MPSAQEAFAALNIGKTNGYELIDAGEFPIEVIRLGRALRVRKAELLQFLGLPLSAAVEVQSAAATNSDAPGVQPGAPIEQPAPISQ